MWYLKVIYCYIIIHILGRRSEWHGDILGFFLFWVDFQEIKCLFLLYFLNMFKIINLKYLHVTCIFLTSVIIHLENLGHSLEFNCSGGSRIFPPSRGRQHTILPNFPKNCMKLKKNWTGGAHIPCTPLDQCMWTLYTI